MVPADRQSSGHEIIWQPQGLGQRTHTSENFRALGNTPVQFIQVSYAIYICKYILIVYLYIYCLFFQVLLGPLHAFIISSKSYYPASRNIILQR